MIKKSYFAFKFYPLLGPFTSDLLPILVKIWKNWPYFFILEHTLLL